MQVGTQGAGGGTDGWWVPWVGSQGWVARVGRLAMPSPALPSPALAQPSPALALPSLSWPGLAVLPAYPGLAVLTAWPGCDCLAWLSVWPGCRVVGEPVVSRGPQ